MKRIDTSSILDPSIAQPFTGLSLDFVQDATKEALAAVIQSSLGDTPSTTIPYVLYGCVKTDLGGGDFSYTAGYIYFNGEVYTFPEIASIAIATADICTITITNDGTADPLEFTDSILRNVHNHRDLVLSDGILGSADFDFQDLVRKSWVLNSTVVVTPNGGTATVSSPPASYKVENGTLDIIFNVQGTITSAGVTGFSMIIPDGFVSAIGFQYDGQYMAYDGLGSPALSGARFQISDSSSTITLEAINGTWTNGADFRLQGHIRMPVA